MSAQNRKLMSNGYLQEKHIKAVLLNASYK